MLPDRAEAIVIRPHTAPWLPFDGVAQFIAGAATETAGTLRCRNLPSPVRSEYGPPPGPPLEDDYIIRRKWTRESRPRRFNATPRPRRPGKTGRPGGPRPRSS